MKRLRLKKELDLVPSPTTLFCSPEIFYECEAEINEHEAEINEQIKWVFSFFFKIFLIVLSEISKMTVLHFVYWVCDFNSFLIIVKMTVQNIISTNVALKGICQVRSFKKKN